MMLKLIVYLQGVYLRSRQKLIIATWQSIHILTRQGRIYVQCVTNGTNVVKVWICTVRHTPAKMCIHVLSVRNVFHLRVACITIWIFMQVNTSAQNVADVVKVISTLQYTNEVIQERNRLNVLFVANDLQHHVTLLCTVEFTVETTRTNVTCVRKHLVSLHICTNTSMSTREINHTSVHCVTKVSAHPATCSNINVKYTAIEDGITVLTVGRYLRKTVIWSVMFVFTLVQSRTHVDTVHSILHGLANSRHICWSYTMKVLGWHVTFVRRNSVRMTILMCIYVDIKVWSLICVVSVKSLYVHYLNWNVMSWCTQTTNSFAVACVVKISNTNVMLSNTLRDVPQI